MANATRTLRVIFDGSTLGLTAAARAARNALRGIDDDSSRLARTSARIASGLLLATQGFAIFAAVGVASGLAVGVALLGVVGLVGGLGIAVAAQAAKVKTAFTGLKNHVLGELQKLARPLESVLVGVAARTQAAFDRIAPALGRMFQAVIPFINLLADSVLGFVENIMPGFEAAINSAGPVVQAFADGLRGFGTSLAEFFRGIAVGAPGAAAAFRGLFNIVNGIIPVLGNLLGVLANAFGPAFEAISPLIVKVVEVLGLFVQALAIQLGPIVTGVAGLLTRLFVPALDAIGAIIRDFVIPTATAFGQTMTQVFTDLQPVFTELGVVFGEVIVALRPLFVEFQRLALEALPGIAAAIREHVIPWLRDTLIPAIRDDLIPWIKDVLVPFIINDLIPALQKFGATIRDDVIPFIRDELIPFIRNDLIPALESLGATSLKVGGFFLSAANTIRTAWNTITTTVTLGVIAVQTVINTLASVPSAVGTFFELARKFIADKLTAAANFARGIPGQISGFFASIPGAIGGFFERARAAVVGALSAMVSAARGIPGQIVSVFSSLPGQLASVGSRMMSSFASGIRAGIGAAVAAAQAAAARVRAIFPFSPAKTGPFSGRGYVTFSGRALTRDFAAAIARGTPDVIASARALADAVSTATQVSVPALGGSAGVARATGGTQPSETVELLRALLVAMQEPPVVNVAVQVGDEPIGARIRTEIARTNREVARRVNVGSGVSF